MHLLGTVRLTRCGIGGTVILCGFCVDLLAFSASHDTQEVVGATFVGWGVGATFVRLHHYLKSWIKVL